MLEVVSVTFESSSKSLEEVSVINESSSKFLEAVSTLVTFLTKETEFLGNHLPFRLTIVTMQGTIGC